MSEGDIDEPIFEKPKKEKKKRVMTEEQKEKLRENLKRGRETAMKNRQKKALGKKIDSEEKNKELDQKIAKKLLGKNKNEDEIENLKLEIKEMKSSQGNSEEVKLLRAELKELKDGIHGEIEKAKSRFKVSTEKKSIPIVEVTEKPTEEVKVEKTKEAQPPPPVKPKKVFSTRKGFSIDGF